ncbi:MAG: Fe-S protein assembly co-chaperone HscB [Gammaproteobacteria bacterium]|nr:Fe-S protein assembly co-chaperone HscB [Gammaproteobacteria bacterium]MBU1655390.1 Fe-S protein assembly co-chaperone HscB [Gammaproteobacteria bacterium]MBU1961843.1 Fe-S protein assembly co-chaperone HscB [Gammaproteobacteria bacterium]
MLDLKQNYFGLFGLPLAYPIDGADLAQRYRDLQRQVHPDRFAAGDERERRLAMQGAARVNEAFETLKDPMLRARYLLSLLGVEMDVTGETTHDTAFLMEQLELREELEGARHTADPYGVTARLMEHIDRGIKALVARMSEQFQDASPERLEQARENVRKMQFLKKLRYDVELVEAEFDEAE